jgi:adenylylsulfate kinase-like enzyme
MAGELQGFTGVNDPYEAPENAELVLDTEHMSPEENADRVIEWMEQQGYLAPVAQGQLVNA